MREEDKSFIRLVWLIANLACFVLPLVLTPVTDTQNWIAQAAEEMTLAMFVLSFPASILFSLGVMLVFTLFSPYDLPVASYLLLWFGLFLTGYFQWFWLIPNMDRKRQFISLGLSNRSETKVDKRHRRRRRKHARRPQLNDASIPILDAANRTPLERVICDR